MKKKSEEVRRRQEGKFWTKSGLFMTIDRKLLTQWKAGKTPAFLISYPGNEVMLFDTEEANDLFDQLTPLHPWVTMHSTPYIPTDPSYIAPNGRGLSDYLRHTLIRSISPELLQGLQ